MPEEDDRFTQEEVDEVVGPVRTLACALGRALSASLHIDQSESIGAVAELDELWMDVADELCAIVKQHEMGESHEGTHGDRPD